MIFSKTKIDGVMVIEAEPFIDDRGAFRRHFCKEEFAKNNIVTDVSQCNVSENKYAKTLRGFHYQLDPHAEGKTLSCLNGRIFDIVVDLREESKTFMQWFGIELSKENRKSIHIAPGCANAFLTLEDNSLIHYYCSKSYHPDSEKGIRFDDPSFNFQWPTKPEVISEKDLSHPNFFKVNILITGASGFVGVPILENLIKSNHVYQIHAFSRSIKDSYPKHEKLKWIEVNLEDAYKVSEIVNKLKIDALIHLAWSDIPNFSYSKCIKNLNQSINLINIILENTECKKLLLAGSCFEYNQTFGECLEQSTTIPKDFFTWSKLSILEYLLLKSKEHGVSLAWFRLFYVYGANQRQGSLLPTLERSLRENKVPSLNTPKNANDFIYVEDVANAFELALNAEFESGVYNLGSGSSTSVIDFCKTLEVVMKNSHQLTTKLIHNTQNSNQEVNFFASIAKTKETFGWTAKTSLVDGLSRSLKK